jgi:hypothetical protein
MPLPKGYWILRNSLSSAVHQSRREILRAKLLLTWPKDTATRPCAISSGNFPRGATHRIPCSLQMLLGAISELPPRRSLLQKPDSDWFSYLHDYSIKGWLVNSLEESKCLLASWRASVLCGIYCIVPSMPMCYAFLNLSLVVVPTESNRLSILDVVPFLFFYIHIKWKFGRKYL